MKIEIDIQKCDDDLSDGGCPYHNYHEPSCGRAKCYCRKLDTLIGIWTYDIGFIYSNSNYPYIKFDFNSIPSFCPFKKGDPDAKL